MKVELKKQSRMLSGWLLIAILAAQFSACGTLQNIELERARNLWEKSGIKNYKMTVEIQKTGHATPNGKFIITVREGRAEPVKRADNLEPVSEYVRFGNYKTIDGVFQYIEQAQKEEGSWDRRVIEYDSKLGYPKKVDLDKARVNDDELFFQVLQFEVLDLSHKNLFQNIFEKIDIKI